ncbi:MAG: DUF1293 family protein [Colwellia sp.]
MSNKIILCGLQLVSFPESKNPQAELATLHMLYPLDNVNAPKFKRKAVGQSTETPFGKQSLSINAKYAHQLIDTGAFVSNKEYELVVGFNTDTFENEISKIIPVDPQLKKHFDEMLK